MAKKERKKADRGFDFSLYPTRNICIKVAYHGHNYDGLAKQDHTANTVETLLVDALKRVRLIDPLPPAGSKSSSTSSPTLQKAEEERVESNGINDDVGGDDDEPTKKTSNNNNHSTIIHKVKAEAAERYVAAARANGHTYTTDATSLTQSMHLQPAQFSRCGRTDKGVSALGNAFSCRMRVSREGKEELDYCKMINMALPNTIRVIGWAYVGDVFDSRFSCTQRTYRYFMHLGGLNLAKMQEAIDLLEGSHDFRNFCKMDVINVGSFVRNIVSAKIVPLCNIQFLPTPQEQAAAVNGTTSTTATPDMSFGYLEIIGNAFLYHQIRCTVTILVLIGKGLEEPSLVRELLDVEKYPSKPCYPLADDSPLVLWDCEFSSTTDVRGKIETGARLQWNFSDDARWMVEQELRDLTTSLMIRSVTAQSMHRQLREWAEDTQTPPQFPVTGVDWTNGKAPVGATKRQAMGCSWEEAFIGGNRTNPYRPILSRPMEKTYEQKVSSLSGNKRERQETNQAKRTPQDPQGEEEEDGC